jgi:hypothetical protein
MSHPLSGFAEKGAAFIQRRWSVVTESKGLRGPLGDKESWRFSRIPAWEREDGVPEKGLKIMFAGRPLLALENYLDPADLPEELRATLAGIYASCSKKFAAYGDAKRLLVLDPHGDLRYRWKEWWTDVFLSMSPPRIIEEIWSGVFDFVDDYSQEWQFEPLFP